MPAVIVNMDFLSLRCDLPIVPCFSTYSTLLRSYLSLSIDNKPKINTRRSPVTVCYFAPFPLVFRMILERKNI